MGLTDETRQALRANGDPAHSAWRRCDQAGKAAVERIVASLSAEGYGGGSNIRFMP